MILTHGANSLPRGGGGSEFVLLNNFDKASVDGLTFMSKAGPDLTSPTVIGDVVDSSVFSGEKCLEVNRMTLDKLSAQVELPSDIDEFTFEMMISSISGSGYGNWFIVGIGDNFIFADFNALNRFQGSAPYNGKVGTFYNGAYYENSSVSQIVFRINNISFPRHYAVVEKQGYAYAFVNGILRCRSSINNKYKRYVQIGFNERYTQGNYGCAEFISIRKGDYSNNLETFTVPTSKYKI